VQKIEIPENKKLIRFGFATCLDCAPWGSKQPNQERRTPQPEFIVSREIRTRRKPDLKIQFSCPSASYRRILGSLQKFSMKSQFIHQIFAAALATVALIQNTSADQGNMERALDALRNARSELSQASHDKGGHRTNAIHIIDQAIEQVKEGIRVGARHGD
jgi:hypothetical protein